MIRGLRCLGVRVAVPLLLSALTITGCATGGGQPVAADAAAMDLGQERRLSELAACHLLRVAQTGEATVADVTVITAMKRYGYSLEAVVQRANQLRMVYSRNWAGLERRAVLDCDHLAEIMQAAPALESMEPSPPPPVLWVRVDGEIKDGFAVQVISELQTTRASGLIINSPGGAVYEARKLGRYLRDNGLRVAVDRFCVSACIDVLAGGAVRLATSNARLGVHQSRVPSRFSSHEGGQIYMAETLRYLRAMGVDADVAIAAAYVPHDEVFLIPLRNALATRLITAVVERL